MSLKTGTHPLSKPTANPKVPFWNPFRDLDLLRLRILLTAHLSRKKQGQKTPLFQNRHFVLLRQRAEHPFGISEDLPKTKSFIIILCFEVRVRLVRSLRRVPLSRPRHSQDRSSVQNWWLLESSTPPPQADLLVQASFRPFAVTLEVSEAVELSLLHRHWSVWALYLLGSRGSAGLLIYQIDRWSTALCVYMDSYLC